MKMFYDASNNKLSVIDRSIETRNLKNTWSYLISQMSFPEIIGEVVLYILSMTYPYKQNVDT